MYQAEVNTFETEQMNLYLLFKETRQVKEGRHSDQLKRVDDSRWITALSIFRSLHSSERIRDTLYKNAIAIKKKKRGR